jgi:transcription elongation factor GreB
VSKAFTKDDRPDEPVVVRHRPRLPDGVPDYVTARGLRALRDQLVTLEPGGSAAAMRSELEQRIASAVLAAPPADRGEIRFGARVRVRDQDGQTRQLQIVGVDEADPAHGLVSWTAPLARALIGHLTGDEVQVQTPQGLIALEILGISYENLAGE